MKKGLFIVFEGPDGGGKTTQIEGVRVRLAEMGYDVIKTREIGGTPEAEKIRELVVRKSGGDWLPLSSLMLASIARYEHTEKVIKPAIAAGKIVLSDRYADSTYVYQAIANHAGVDHFNDIYKITLGDFKPDVTFVLDVDPAVSVTRMRQSVQVNVSREEKADDRFEGQGETLQQITRRTYLELARADPSGHIIIDAGQNVDKVAEDVWINLKDRLPPHD